MTAKASKSAQTNKKSGAVKGGSGSKSPSNGVDVLARLQRSAAKLPRIIRPQYETFDVPVSGETVTIQKIPIGPRDAILEAAMVGDDGINMGIFYHHMVHEALVIPELTFDEIRLLDPEDFDMIRERAEAQSYRKVGEVVSTFPSAESPTE